GGNRRHDPCRQAPVASGGRRPVRPAPLAPGGERHDRNREDHIAAPAVGRVDGDGPAAGHTYAAGGHRLPRRRERADRVRRVVPDAGARSTAIWPDEAALSLWDLPPDRLTTTLLALVEHGGGAAAYYHDVLEAIVSLAVRAPCGPPADAADFLARLDADWLTRVHGTVP